MDATLHALVDLLIKSIPTGILFVFLVYYLKAVYFRPVAAILEERRRSTEGLRELSQNAFESADQKANEFQRRLQAARSEIGQENEEIRRGWLEEQAQAIAQARADAEVKLFAARRKISEEVEQAGTQIGASIQPLTEQIITALSRRRAA